MKLQRSLAVCALVLASMSSGCWNDPGAENARDAERVTSAREHGDEGRGEHGGEHGRGRRGEHNREEGHDGEGEESGTELALTERYDAVRNGVRLTLAYDTQSNTFSGTVLNTTNATLRRVRVEVHLSNGKELGPTTPLDLGPGEQSSVKLMATSQGFERWTAHPEVGSGEHGHGESRGEHGRGGR